MGMIVLLFLLGILVGGLVNQLGADLLRRREPTESPCPDADEDQDQDPHCLHLDGGRPWWHRFGVVALVTGRSRCPSCGARTALRSALIEIGLGSIYGYLWIAFGPSMTLLFYSLYSAILALVVVTDLERRLILDVVVYPAIVLGLVGSFFVPDVSWLAALVGGAVGFVFFYLAALLGRVAFGAGALGGGDVKLAAFVGIITGFPLVIEAIVLTILIGAAISLFLLLTGLLTMRDHIPYGPFLVGGALVTLLWGYQIAEWALR
jgi:leader peptidase (prepilin peptidase)/N-methyltransferase